MKSGTRVKRRCAIDRKSGEPHEDGIILAPPRTAPDTGRRLSSGDGRNRQARRRDDPQILRGGRGDEASTNESGSARHAHMHRTETIDYGIVLEGEITLIVDEGESVVRRATSSFSEARIMRGQTGRARAAGLRSS